jgi:type VI protein secretion system component VasF
MVKSEYVCEDKKKRRKKRKTVAKKPTRRVHMTLSKRVPMRFNQPVSKQNLKEVRNLCRAVGFKGATKVGARIIHQVERVERDVLYRALKNVANRTPDASNKQFSRTHGKKLQEELNVRGLNIRLRLHAKAKKK